MELEVAIIEFILPACKPRVLQGVSHFPWAFGLVFLL